jgi:hypothetical protein
MRIKMIIDEEQFMIILFCELREKSKQNRMGDFLFFLKQLSIEKKISSDQITFLLKSKARNTQMQTIN